MKLDEGPGDDGLQAARRHRFFLLASMDNSEPRKIVVLRWHMAGVRLSTARPAPANRLAPVVHDGFYVLVVLMAGTGFATALAAGLPEIVFAGSGGIERASRPRRKRMSLCCKLCVRHQKSGASYPFSQIAVADQYDVESKRRQPSALWCK